MNHIEQLSDEVLENMFSASSVCYCTPFVFTMNPPH